MYVNEMGNKSSKSIRKHTSKVVEKGISINNKSENELIVKYTNKGGFDDAYDDNWGEIIIKPYSQIMFDMWRYDGINFPNGKETNIPHGLQDVYKIEVFKDHAIYYGKSYSTAAHPLNKELVRTDKF
jgi:hypothetical protein